MQLNINNMTPAQFLAEYWQKKPLVIRQGFQNFQDLLSPDEMAGLAMEDEVESRLIWQEGEKWQAGFGPFEAFDHLGEENWTLVVQALNHWVPAAEQLAQQFDFIPRWRFDDVMASFAVPGGSVGPHIDNYDVFICQGSGRRRWKVGALGGHREFAAHEALLHTDPFEPIIDVELLPGDILYLPPGYPHEGVTLEASMSFSVGFRAPSTRDMFTSLADYLIDQDLGKVQITDPDRSITTTPGCITQNDVWRIYQQLIGQASNDVISDFIGRHFSTSKCQLDLAEEEWDISEEEWQADLMMQPMTRLGGLRHHYFDGNYRQGIMYINGERYNVSPEIAGIIPLLCNHQQLDMQQLMPWLEKPEAVALITQFIRKGFWYFAADDEFDEE